MTSIKGNVHSIQSMGTLDGPGIRFVVFVQGCNLRCRCCHNPDTWEMDSGKSYTPEDILSKVIRYKEYFAQDGGITISGGEPLLQPKFVGRVFELCHENGINTCLDTSGSILNEDVKVLLSHTDRVLLDIKYTSDDDYREYVGCSMNSVMEFLEFLDEKKIPTTLRQVIIPTINDNTENMLRLKAITEKYQCIDKTELLPFKKICQVKYDKLGILFPFGNLPEPKKDDIERLENILKAEH